MPCLQANNSENHYSACLLGKMTRIPFKPANQASTAPLELVHSDLCGLMPVQQKSISGCCYFMLFVDDFTKFTMVYFLKSKNEAATHFENYKAAVEKLHSGSEKGYQIKAIRTDGGGEYSCERFPKELKTCRIE